MDLRAIQAAAVANKVAKGLNTTDVPLEVALLIGEVGEAFTAWRRGEPGFDLELADIFLFSVGLAGMTGLDLHAEVERTALHWRQPADVSVPLQFGLLTRKATDALTAWLENQDIGRHLASAFLLLAALAGMTGVDLQDAVERKMRINAGRVYRRDARGVSIKVTTQPEPRT
ncbi:hypothetical protein ACH4GK_31930 [Streptomyces rimosus]|uniref:hypothetical protein n=1 Tax=Streptomyces rimosus TaxID=1927 RepID=UPI00067D9A08|nr:hypothetical protein [Streptomyces rimosus]